MTIAPRTNRMTGLAFLLLAVVLVAAFIGHADACAEEVSRVCAMKQGASAWHGPVLVADVARSAGSWRGPDVELRPAGTDGTSAEVSPARSTTLRI